LDWLRFLKAETEEEFKMLAEKNPVIKEAYCKLQVMSEDEANRMLYEARLKAQRDEYSRVHGAWQDGWQEGQQDGWQKGPERQKELVRKLRDLGVSVEKIALAAGLSVDEIAAL
jgi:predicted transposase/invertase (TIGR01784 family)